MSYHPVDDGGGDYIIDPGSMVGLVSTILQIVLALVGPDTAKAALEHEIQAARKAADDTRDAGREADLEAIRKKFGL